MVAEEPTARTSPPFDQLLARVSQRLSDYQQSRQPVTVLEGAALDEAAALWQAAQPGNPARPAAEHDDRLAAACHALGWLYFFRFDVLPAGSNLPELARAVVFLAGLAYVPTAIPEPLHAVLGPAADAGGQADLATSLLRAAQTTPDPALLDAGITLLDAAVCGTPPDDPDRARRLDDLGFACHQRYRRDRGSADLDRAIELGEQALEAAPEHPERARLCTNLGSAYRARVERTESSSDLERAIELSEQAVRLTLLGDPNRHAFLANLARAYRDRFERTGASADLERAIELGEQAVAITPDGDLAGALFTLGGAYLRRFERIGMLADLERAIELGERSTSAEADDQLTRARSLSLLDLAHRERFQRTGVFADLERAIELGEQAADITPRDHPGFAVCVDNLGLAYQRRHERTGASADLERAIELGEQAVAATPVEHAGRAGRQANLCIAYQRRYGRLGALGDLERAVELGEQAAAAKPDGHPIRTSALSHLSVAYRDRFERVGVLADLERAIEVGEEAVAATPDDHPGLVISSSQLHLAYRLRFQRLGEPADLERAIELGEQAVTALPDDHANRAMYLSNLGPAYQERFERFGQPADLERAIDVGEQAVTATPDDHPSQAGHLANLGRAYRARLSAGEPVIGQQALRTLARRVTQAATASPTDQVEARFVAGSLAHAMDEHELAVSLLDEAAHLLPSIAPREAGWADQERRLGRYSGLVGESVAAHCALGDPSGAVRTAELGRGILLAAQMDSRTDITDLGNQHPELAAQFRRLRDELTTPRDSRDAADEVAERKRLWAEHDSLVDRIRTQPGFARFLLPPRLTDLRSAATEGAVVLVNAGRRRADAVIVTATGDPRLVPLPELAFADVQSQTDALLSATHHARPVADALKKQRALGEILGWLWDTIVVSVVAALPISPTAEALPRLWWMPSGVLGLFPLHAAGHPGQPGALDAVVSSYTPTLRVLAHARSRPPATTRRQLTVALQHTPGFPDLPGTVTEADHLHADHPGTTPLTDRHATTERVLAALPEATWAHFACHATADHSAPSRSGLRLHDDLLALPEISRLRLGHAELAYLSACSTAHRGVLHADESLHLASAFQLAGFRHVVASLWPLDDHIAATATRELYRRLPDTPTADHTATALHQVTRALRRARPGRPDLWAPLVHSGP